METKICSSCKKPKPITNFRPKTRYKTKNGIVRRRASICRKCVSEEKRSKGLCNCGRPLAMGHSSKCESCRNSIRKSERKRKQRLKSQTFDYYGRRCVYCGENHEVFLTIDHMNNDGCEHRKEMTTNNIYAWLVKNHFPAGFQTACYNCNCAKAHIGEDALKSVLST